MTRTTLLLIWALPITFTLLSSCKSTKKYFNVTSHPEGATIYIDGEPRGQTNAEKLAVDFKIERPVTLHLEMDGHQTDGTILTKDSPPLAAFFLNEAPRNREILKLIDNLQRHVDRLTSTVEEDILETKRARLQE